MNVSMILSVLILLTCFVLMGNRKAGAYIRTFRIQSALLAASVLWLGVENFRQGLGRSLFIIGAIIVLLKVLYVPRLLLKTFDRVKGDNEKDYFLNIPVLELIAFSVVLFLYNLLKSAGIADSGDFTTYLVNSVSVIFIGFLFLMSRKKAVGQIVGFLVMENGLFVTAMHAAHGMPFIVELGIFIDLITAVLIMGMLVFRIHKEFQSTDIDKLKNLRG